MKAGATTTKRPTDYLGLFTVESWREFKRHGGELMGFTDKKLKMAERLQPGDRLLCYLTKVSAFVAVLEVTGPSFVDRKKTIWSDGLFPVRLPVKIAIELPLSNAVPIRSLAGQLSFMPEGGRGAGWTIYVRSSPRKWRDDDAEAVIEALANKARTLSQASPEPDPSAPVAAKTTKPRKRMKLPEKFRVGRVVAKTDKLSEDEPAELLSSYENTLSFNKVTGYSVNVPIAATCRPTAMCMKTCYFAAGAPSWANALRHQRKVMHTLQTDPKGFAERVALEYDKLGLTFIRWNGGGDLFAESVEALNHLARIRPDIVLWVVTRIPEWAAQVEHHPNVYIHFSLDRHSLKRREEFLAKKPLNKNYFFSYQCDKGEVPPEDNLSYISILFFDNYEPTTDLSAIQQDIVCPLNEGKDITGICENCRRCFDGFAVAHQSTL